MKIGFIIPTNHEAQNISIQNVHVVSAGYGAGKVPACAAAANLIFNKHCDTIVIWGAAGALSPRIKANDIVIGTRVAYRDYDICPLLGSTGVGWVPGFAENIFVDLDRKLADLLKTRLKAAFPQKNVTEGTVCTGDQFVQHASRESYNRVEKVSDIVDMESAAVVQFCKAVDPAVKVGIVRFISDNADHTAHVDFFSFLEELAEMNKKMFDIRQKMLSACPAEYNPAEDPGNIFSCRAGFEDICHRLYDEFNVRYADAGITKIAGIEPDGFLLGWELAKMFGVPFVPVRKTAGTVIEGAGKELLNSSDNVLLADAGPAAADPLIAARNAITGTGAKCEHAIVLGNGRIDREKLVRENIRLTSFPAIQKP